MTIIAFFILFILWCAVLYILYEHRKKSMKILEESEARYKLLLNNMSSGVSVFQYEDESKGFIFKDINAAGEKIYKIRKKEIIGRNLEIIFPNTKDFGLLEAMHRVNQTGKPEYHPDIQYEDEKLIGWRKHFIYKLPSGQIVSIYSDDTQQKLTELALIDFESRYRTLFNNANDAILVHDFAGGIIEVNRIACELIGYQREELEQMKMTDIIDSEDIFTPEQLKKIEKERSLVYETAYRHMDGTIIPVEVSIRVVEYDLKPVIMTLSRDIRERKKVEAEKEELINQLRHSQKMEAIGTLAGGIAHDFNNILQIIFGYVQLSMFEAREKNLASHLSELMTASQRAKELVQHILTFSRQGECKRQPLKIQPIIKETLKLMRATLPANIEIRSNINVECPHIIADPTHIHQVIMNLCTNAYHAMREKGGILEVNLDETNISNDDVISKISLEPGRYLHLTVGDTGHGMESAVKDRVFDPYFTTKGKGEGTGLGLSVVHGIVKSIGGHVSVYSEPGQGSVFNVWIPIAETDTPAANVLSPESAIGGNEHILLVDDEEAIVRMEQSLLKRLGYEVTTRMSSVDAYALFKEHPDRFDLVITDMAMPNMSGAELSQKMLNIRPDIPIILCTGFSEVVSAEKAKSIGIKGYITKPVIMKQLASSIRNILDEKEIPMDIF